MSHSTTLAAAKSGRLTGFRSRIVSQFGNPCGFWGHVVGTIMSRRPSNRKRNAWTVDLVGLQPGERVLEIGFGPGLALRRASEHVGDEGFVAGVDRSAVMHAQAARRNAAPLARQRMDLRLASVEALPDFGVRFDAILAINTVMFWPSREARIRDLRDRLAPRGRLAITVQPRSKGATAKTSAMVKDELVAQLHEAGFERVTAHTLPLNPPAVCVLGVRDSMET